MKKTMVLIAALSLCAWKGYCQKLEVVVKNISNDKGVVMVGLFNSEKTFMKEAWRGEKPKAQPGVIHVVFQDIPDGDYAVSVYHDENQNGKLDSNFMGIPKEGFGFSHDAMGTFGPPSYEKAKFRSSATTSLVVNLKYY